MKKISMIIVMLIVTMIISSGCSSKDDNTLVVGMELAYPPFETTDKDGKPSGISIDLANELGKYLGRTVKIENIAYSGLIPSLTTKKVDMVLSSMTITEERKNTVDFSEPYCKAYLALLINKNSAVSSIKDLNHKGKKVAVKKGTTGYFYAMKNLKNAEILVFDKETACVLEVAQGRADAFIYDQMTIFKNWQQYESSTKALLEPFNDYEYWGIALRKGDSELRNNINTFLKEYEEQKGFEKLSDKYLGDIKKEFDKRKIPFFFGSK
ncbi:transporter substrate-binding domain-containing protein [Clostridium sp. ZS2-4]|uniref:transporter substrate-binding domain-containing protein n=1 Tax=Clostridium sp. ZS2-4 TaxID=2987703 RepID=UPI00227AFD14|nr:transporter substrate-binding domain-containing protein [Clostridium sp. ZS2-4]MCY6356877.1 transporter substrate-binding domain-containing protein [Clostridium sp. ZS2-4]